MSGAIKDYKDHINRRILHSGSKAQKRGIPEIRVCRIVMFMRSFGPLTITGNSRTNSGSTFEKSKSV